MTHLFQRQSFIAHSSRRLDWKIECDALTDEDWDTLAWRVAQNVRFGSVYGIPNGGIRFARALEPYVTSGPRLIVDDVLTTGKSMREARQSSSDLGVVVFARGICPHWVTPIFSLTL